MHRRVIDELIEPTSMRPTDFKSIRLLPWRGVPSSRSLGTLLSEKISFLDCGCKWNIAVYWSKYSIWIFQLLFCWQVNATLSITVQKSQLPFSWFFPEHCKVVGKLSKPPNGRVTVVLRHLGLMATPSLHVVYLLQFHTVRQTHI